MGRRESILEGESPDVSIVPVVGSADLVTVSSTDFFSPITMDPYKQGRIAAANTISDLYAAGCVQLNSMLMILGCSTAMDPAHRRIVTEQMVKGFQDACDEAGVPVTGGQTVLNPWPILGGAVIATLPRSSMVASTAVVPDDILVLTKPLGTQVAGNLQVWMMYEEKWARASSIIDEDAARRAITISELSMATLNKAAAILMKKHGAHGATDITGFGFLGHAKNLAAIQKAEVDLVLDTLPVIAGMKELSAGAMGPNFRLLKGLSAETSGGLLIALPNMEAAEKFLEEYKQDPSNPEKWGWIVGKSTKGSRQAYWEEHSESAPKIVEV
mmetsp:Transcript_41837/g.89808  ORF Transcript_41837/g.89808 Transcript_41837/m.89808 type:complete len:328 (-) Transcript_41837:54-1037(-)